MDAGKKCISHGNEPAAMGNEDWYKYRPDCSRHGGQEKYAYGIGGSVVNVASRMESNGETRRVNISAATNELIMLQFAFTYKGKYLRRILEKLICFLWTGR